MNGELRVLLCRRPESFRELLIAFPARVQDRMRLAQVAQRLLWSVDFSKTGFVLRARRRER